jgi:hypothetical protein
LRQPGRGATFLARPGCTAECFAHGTTQRQQADGAGRAAVRQRSCDTFECRDKCNALAGRFGQARGFGEVSLALSSAGAVQLQVAEQTQRIDEALTVSLIAHERYRSLGKRPCCCRLPVGCCQHCLQQERTSEPETVSMRPRQGIGGTDQTAREVVVRQLPGHLSSG